MIHRRTFIALTAVTCSAAYAAAWAAGPIAFTPSAFQAAKASGQPILIEVTAPWCPTCRAQKPILSELTAQPRFAAMRVLTVDFDSQKDVLRSLNVQMQSTLIVFKGDREVGRSSGDTNRASIEALLAKTL
ncbi:thioredoxin family protein [Phreatobacter aquaticus]|uniref:Thioredoxin family protein n=1 Tax=Phreatobacter aquaticus TaxID=2570229 RepID=A0A4D7QG94_9HYPH|nr:thioredoxin family protein [Phreatobacter aquaticus]QCK85731.1 thioredoxin family protein [Phreatobacter aquaticus]